MTSRILYCLWVKVYLSTVLISGEDMWRWMNGDQDREEIQPSSVSIYSPAHTNSLHPLIIPLNINTVKNDHLKETVNQVLEMNSKDKALSSVDCKTEKNGQNGDTTDVCT